MRRIAKSAFNSLAAVLILPALALYVASCAVLGKQAALQSWAQCLCLIPGVSGVFLRRAFYRVALARFAGEPHVGFGSMFSQPSAQVSAGVYIGNFCSIGWASIGADTLIASYVSILSGGRQHRIDDPTVPIRRQSGTIDCVHIGENSWIGERAVIMADIGRNCVIGAGAVVTRPIPDNSVAVGAPARVVRTRNATWSDERCIVVG
jgi:acetyltransferase-like isoleucine patch superfamily enzyme